jgi:epimerase transport system membrane fusion protein
LKAREARLTAQRDQLDQVNFPESLDSNDLNARQELAAQTSIFSSQKASRESTIEVFEQRVGQLQSKLNGLDALKSAKEELARSYAEELSDVGELLSQGLERPAYKSF